MNKKNFEGGEEQAPDLVINSGGLIVRDGETKHFGSVVIGRGAKIVRGNEHDPELEKEMADLEKEMAGLDEEIEGDLRDAGRESGEAQARQRRIDARKMKREPRKKELSQKIEANGDKKDGRVNTGIIMRGGSMSVGSVTAENLEITGGSVDADKIVADSMKVKGGSALTYGEMEVKHKTIAPEATVTQRPVSEKKKKSWWNLF
ncbi:MAG: hypothetical protein MUD10_01850 [Candidatus Pacebacteria bacterium]|jgi:hypothetical protein|nr:hypothetical protein [Candidatus Paceibacterota bacterium]